ncbi:MAG TPA: tetratricopeptide repeat protein [Candidatus Hydrogenedentes bacterium]|nr:tetratricopeptide repeat protein [Candidatus Hydrogenedentota bacterium]
MMKKLVNWWHTRNGRSLSGLVDSACKALEGENAEAATGRLEMVLEHAAALDKAARGARSLDQHIGRGFALLGRYRARTQARAEGMRLFEKAELYSPLQADDTLFYAELMAMERRKDKKAWSIYRQVCGRRDISPSIVSFLASESEISPLTPAKAMGEKAGRCKQLFDSGARWPWVLLSLAYFDRMGGAPAASVRRFAEALETKRGSDQRLKFIEGTLLSLSGNVEKATQVFAGALRKESEASWVDLYYAGIHAVRVGDNKEGHRLLNLSQDRLGKRAACFELQFGHIAFLEARFAEAMERYTEANQLDGGDWRPVYWAGRVYLCKGKYDQALNSFKKSLAIDSNDCNRFGAGVMHELMGQYDQAAVMYGGCKEGAVRDRAFLRKALCLAKTGHHNESVDILNRLLGSNLGDPARYYLGIIQSIRGDYEEAQVVWEGIRSEPWKTYVPRWRTISRRLQGDALLEECKWEEAIGFWSTLMNELPAAEKSVGSMNLAEAEFRRVAGIDPRGGGQKRRMEMLTGILSQQPSSRRDFYALVLAAAQGEAAAVEESVFSDSQYGPRARFHRAVCQARSGQMVETDLMEVSRDDSFYRQAVGFVRARNAMAKRDISEVLKHVVALNDGGSGEGENP